MIKMDINDDTILMMGGTEEDIIAYANRHGADLTKEDLDIQDAIESGVRIRYGEIDPWKFLDNLAATIITLQVQYDDGGPFAELVPKCDRAIHNITELKQLISDIHI